MAHNFTRQSNELLDKYALAAASLTLQLYPDYWTLNQGSKFLYNSPAAAIFEDIRAYRIPVDLLELFDAAKVPFYEGCMIVDLQDHRVHKAKDKRAPDDSKSYECSRILLRPNTESLWADLCLLNQKAGSKWTDQEALDVEARILMATSPPLCLDPDPHLGRVANSMFRVSAPRTPAALRPRKRKAAAMEFSEADEREQARRAKILSYMDPKRNRSATPSCVDLKLLSKLLT
ncbi:hypothetical protein FA95DRAFT_1490339 [Auriscalpium vulgare]|uniref:Uncharacterized protein n=1 Tax=Auriscalpium vulgare TaxID=40419 RepID=A0ACB8RX34_9AGAM|nr:hypothetical protein FA95DRAFT_1490339 [Auriscalpium vulgare]